MSEANKITVPLLDLKAQFRELKQPIMQSIEAVCDSQWFVMGPNVKELEERVAEYSECRFGVGVSSGTDALLVALMALEIGPGHAVITTSVHVFCDWGYDCATRRAAAFLRHRSEHLQYQRGMRRDID